MPRASDGQAAAAAEDLRVVRLEQALARAEAAAAALERRHCALRAEVEAALAALDQLIAGLSGEVTPHG